MKKLLLALTLTLAVAGSAVGQTPPAYDNLTNFSGFGITQEFAADDGLGNNNIQTHLMMDDITLAAGFDSGAWSIRDITWGIVNFNAGPTTARMKLRFYDNDGGGAGFGDPGTFLGGIDFAAFALPTLDSFFIFTLADFTFLPVPTDGTFWAGIVFDNGGGATTALELDNLGQLTFDPPVLGSSSDLGWYSDDTLGNFTANNPLGGTFTSADFVPDPLPVPVSFGWAFTVQPIPEPTTWALLGLGACGVVPAYRRWKASRAKGQQASRLFAKK